MFFTYFSQIMSSGVDYNLTISQTAAGDIVVILLPKVHDLKDGAGHKIGPLKISGSPQDLDREFFPTITAPIQKTSGILLNMKDYEEQQKAAEAESKAAKDEKDKLSKAAKEKKDKYDGFMKKAEELETAGNFDGAIMQLQQARLHATDKTTKTVDEKITALRAKSGQGSLFEVPATQPAPQPLTAQPAPTPVQQPAAAPMATQPVQAAQTPQVAPQDTPQVAPPSAANYSPEDSFWPEMESASYRGNEYEEIVDFPSEMLPPTYSGGMTAGAM